MLSSILPLLAVLPFVSALPAANDIHDHSHQTNKRLPSSWYLPENHPAHAVFGRAPGDGIAYAQVGSPTWSSAFPSTTPDSTKLPAEWVNALNAAVAAGKIPNIPTSTNTPGVNPVYPAGVNPNGPEVCSATYKCRNPGDVWDAPTGFFGTGFDDGPTPSTPKLLNFLQQNHETSTHFMIGVNILQHPQEFQATFDAGNDLAVHTWTHPYMTTLSNLDVVAQLGWTSLLIKNSTGGRVPKFWRPPFGDSDNRVRAIAKEVFGLTAVLWNRDTEDWSLTTGGTTPQVVHNSMVEWLSGPKTPGLIVLEHELSDLSVQAFIDAYPIMKSNGWNTMSVTRLIDGGNIYQNSKDSVSPVTPASILAGPSTSPPPPTNSSSISSSVSSPPTSSSPPTPTSQTQTPAGTVTGTGTGTGTGLAASVKPSNSAARGSQTTWKTTLTGISLAMALLSAMS